VNSEEGRNEEINFWSEVEPLFHRLDKPVYMFAGDVGGASYSDNIMYDHYDNITFIASGMGNGKKDNFILVHVTDSTVTFELVALEGDDIHALGNVEDYRVH
jgi:hypothetical protein